MKRKVRRFAEGGYEENPEPGSNLREITSKRKSKPSKTAPRDVSPMEFIKGYEDSEPSQAMRDEAARALAPRKSSIKPYTGEYEETRDVMSNLTPEQKKELLEQGVEGLALAGLGEAQIPLRIKQLLRARQIAKANEAMRDIDKAGEAARRGMSRRDIPSDVDRYRAGVQAKEIRASHQAGDKRIARELYGPKPRWKWSDPVKTLDIPDWGGQPWKKGGRIKGYKAGGSVQSKASSRGDGIASRGKTKGRFV